MSSSSTSSAPRIVVGVDASPSSRAALRWAVRYASLTGGTVDAVQARHAEQVDAIGGFGQTPAEVDDQDVVADEARRALDSLVNEEVAPDDRHRVTCRVFNGHPAESLMNAAADADLLVVGSRGRGGFGGALLGSVGQYLTHHSPCPVVIMRGKLPA